MEEARTILLFKDLCMQLLILASPAELGAGRTLSLDSYLAYLSTKETVDVHTYDQAPDEAGEYVQPVSLDAARAVALFRSLSAGPVNFLNLDVYKQNEIPDCLVDLPAYSLLRDLRNHNHSGQADREAAQRSLRLHRLPDLRQGRLLLLPAHRPPRRREHHAG